MITVKAGHKIFACSEVTHLTGICAGHLQNLRDLFRMLGVNGVAKALEGWQRSRV